jgi:hypothetical protein
VSRGYRHYFPPLKKVSDLSCKNDIFASHQLASRLVIFIIVFVLIFLLLVKLILIQFFYFVFRG